MEFQKEKHVNIYDLEDDILKQYKKFGVQIKIIGRQCRKGRVVFEIKPKGNTRERHIHDHADEIQMRLDLPMLQVVKEGVKLYLIALPYELVNSHLPDVLEDPGCQRPLNEAELPYIIGHDIFGDEVIEDIAEFPHLLLGGSTGSGKSVGLQDLITSIAYNKSPSMVNLILIDVGATDLLVFEKLPHLSCPIVQDRTSAAYVLKTLTTEMERRIALEHTNPLKFFLLPRLVVVIDEFPALFMEVDKPTSRVMVEAVSNLLQRGRHAEIHVVLAAQNPTFQNMKVDLGNITARIAFKCAKKNFSDTILGEGGAENLSGRGDMLFKSPADGLQRIQGTHATEEELARLVEWISLKYSRKKYKKFTLKISDDVLTESTGENLSCAVVRRGPSKENQLLADIIVWALERDSISINLLMERFHVGWNKAAKFMKRLEELGLVDRPEGKLPRDVIPSCPEELPEELQKFLAKAGYSSDSLLSTFHRG